LSFEIAAAPGDRVPPSRTGSDGVGEAVGGGVGVWLGVAAKSVAVGKAGAGVAAGAQAARMNMQKILANKRLIFFLTYSMQKMGAPARAAARTADFSAWKGFPCGVFGLP